MSQSWLAIAALVAMLKTGDHLICSRDVYAGTVRLFERAGAAAIQLEDQTFPKRCGHLADKSVIPASEMAAKIKAAVDARASEETLIVARTMQGLFGGVIIPCVFSAVFRLFTASQQPRATVLAIDQGRVLFDRRPH